jgi:tetraacyldisaccharide 4'-kinase
VCADRYLAGRFAEEQLQVTVHLLDDGFQHLALCRDVDLLLADRADLTDRVLPLGRLRESPAAAALADALLTTEDDDAVLDELRSFLRIPTVFRVRRSFGPVTLMSTGAVVEPSANVPALAVAGIARPNRFFGDLDQAGWSIVGRIAFSDHRRFTEADKDRVVRQVRDTGAALVVTTAKDAVRWTESPLAGVPVAVAGLAAIVEPASFGGWLLERLHHARARERGATEAR